MGVIIINKTKVPIKKLHEIIRFVRPKGISIPKIVVRSVQSFCFYGAYYYDFENSLGVYASVGPCEEFPKFVIRSKASKREGYLDNFWLKSKEEAIIYLLAHELRHCFQDQFPDAPRLGYKNRNQKWSETDADFYALQKLKKWRMRKKV